MSEYKIEIHVDKYEPNQIVLVFSNKPIVSSTWFGIKSLEQKLEALLKVIEKNKLALKQGIKEMFNEEDHKKQQEWMKLSAPVEIPNEAPNKFVDYGEIQKQNDLARKKLKEY